MRKPRITQAMIDRAFARQEPARSHREPARKNGFVRYPSGTVVFKRVMTGARIKFVLALYVPPGALVYRGSKAFWSFRAGHIKCRTEQAYVIGRVFGKAVRATKSTYRGPFQPRDQRYKPGEWYKADGFDLRPIECAKGVHFFETLTEARSF